MKSNYIAKEYHARFISELSQKIEDLHSKYLRERGNLSSEYDFNYAEWESLSNYRAELFEIKFDDE